MDKKKFLNLKNHYQQGLLKNGMKYIISPNPLHNTFLLLFLLGLVLVTRKWKNMVWLIF